MCGFVDLEKAFDRVPREVTRWAMHKLGVEEWLVSAVISMYTGAKTVVRRVYGNSSGFEVTVGMHQGSAYNSCQGKATLNSLDMASMTITNNSWLNAEPWCMPTVTSKPLLLP